MDFQYEGADDLGGRILWGRVGILAVGVLFFFLLGRCSGGGGGVDISELETLQTENATLQTQRDQLQTENQQLITENATLENMLIELGVNPDDPSAGAGAGGGTGDAGTGETGTGETDTGDTGTTPTTPGSDSLYVVQAGDTLSTIADQVYGDPGQFLAIAEANGISGDDPLTVGQELIIPANPDG